MTPLLIDTHCHSNFNAYKDDADDVIRRALEQDVWMIGVGSQMSTSRRAVEAAEQYPEGVYAIVGLHPMHLVAQEVDEEETHFTTREELFDGAAYEALARNPKVVGIGECGLDYFRLPEGREQEAKRLQRETFEQHIALAETLGKTLMIHSRDAYADIFDALQPHMRTLKAAVIHSFIGSPNEAKQFLQIGCYIGLNGIITYKPRKEKKPGSSDPGLLNAIKGMPLDRIVLETDAPYLSPDPHRGERNEPSYVRLVAEKLADIHGIAFDRIAETTTMNARAIFGI